MMAQRWLAALWAVPLATVPLSASAQTTGLDMIHAQSRVGNKICMTEHEHFGDGSMPTKRAAQQAAVQSWSGFTAFEYGSLWGRYALAVGKNLECTESGGRWVCKVRARPCRPAR